MDSNPAKADQLSKELGIARLRYLNAEHLWLELVDEVYAYKSKYPYGPFSREAELLQANAWFQKGDYPEAIAATMTSLPGIPIFQRQNYVL